MSGQFSIDRKKEIKEFISKQLSEYVGNDKTNVSLLEISNKLDIIIKLLATMNNFKPISKENLKETEISNKKNINIDDQFIPEINLSDLDTSSNININKTESKVSEKTLNKMKEVLGK